MKQASRFMPEHTPENVNISKTGGFLSIGLLVAVSFYAPMFLVFAFGTLLLLYIWGYFEQIKMNEYFDRLCDERKTLSICEFARAFDTRKIDTWVIRATYEEVQRAIGLEKTMPIKASDHLFDTLKLDEDDIDLDLVESISQRAGRSLDNVEKNPFIGKVTDVRSLVLFVNAQPTMNAT